MRFKVFGELLQVSQALGAPLQFPLDVVAGLDRANAVGNPKLKQL